MEIITADEIRRSGADNLPDILQFTAGIEVRRYGFVDAEVSVRGYDQPTSPRLLVLINGRQVYLDDYGRTAWQALPVQIDEIRQIEVVRGPNSALFGFNAVGGVINIITYDPLLDSTNVATVRGGTHDYAAGSTVATFHAGETAGLRLSAGGFRADEFSTSSLPAELGPYNESPHQFAFGADGRLKLAPNVELTVEGTAVDGRSFETLPTPISADDTYRVYSFKAGVVADSPYGLLNFSAYRNDLEFEVRAAGIDGVITEKNEVDVVQASDLFKLGTDHTVRLGFEYRDNTLTGANSLGRIGYRVYAESAMWEWQITPRIAVTNAVRVDYLTLNYTGALVPDIPYTLADYNRAMLNEVSFNTGLVYKQSDKDTIRLLVARGVQAPSLVDFGLQTTTNYGGRQISSIGNPTLNASSLLNYEFDYARALPALNATLATALYYQRTDNLLASAVNLPLVPGAGGLVSYAQNVGGSSAVGGEIELKGASGSGVLWNVSYSHVDIKDHLSLGTLSGSSLGLDYDHGSPAHVIDAGVGYSWDRVEVKTEARWQSHFTDCGQSPTLGVEPVLIDHYVTMTARIAYRLTGNLRLALVATQLGRAQQLEAAGAPVERRVYLTLTGKR